MTGPAGSARSPRPRRVGLMIPSSNTMMEVDFARDLPAGTALHTARMYMEDTTPAGENRMPQCTMSTRYFETLGSLHRPVMIEIYGRAAVAHGCQV